MAWGGSMTKPYRVWRRCTRRRDKNAFSCIYGRSWARRAIILDGLHADLFDVYNKHTSVCKIETMPTFQLLVTIREVWDPFQGFHSSHNWIFVQTRQFCQSYSSKVQTSRFFEEKVLQEWSSLKMINHVAKSKIVYRSKCMASSKFPKVWQILERQF